MIRKSIAASFAAVAIAASVGGCSTAPVQTAYGPMPQYCTQNNTATGAILGTLIGAGLGAAIGGGRGAAIGAASGLALGGVSGAQADAQCRQIALQQMVEMAAAQQAEALAQQRPSPHGHTEKQLYQPHDQGNVFGLRFDRIRRQRQDQRQRLRSDLRRSRRQSARSLVDLATALLLVDRLQPAAIECNDPVEAAREIEVMCRNQRREPIIADEVQKRVEYAFAGRVIEIAGRLVAEQDLGVVGECTGDRDPLLLAAGEPRRPVAGARAEADAVEQHGRFRSRPGAGDPGDHLRQHDVFERRKFRQQVMELIDETDLGAPQQGPALVG